MQPLLDAFGRDHPEFEKNVFIAMRFRSGKQFSELHQSIKTGLAKYGLFGLRADDKAYPPDGDLWANICVYLLGCKYGVCVFEEINEREFNPNVPLEYGFMRALNKHVLLLKDQRMPKLPTDMTGKIHRNFDSYNITETVHEQIGQWAKRDLGLKAVNQREKILDLLDSTIEKTVLILGRFTTDRQPVLDGLRKELARYGYDPVLLDSAGRPANRDVYETLSTLAHLSCFIIADLTADQSTPMELQMIVANLMVPVAPIILSSKSEPGMFDFLKRYPWVLDTFSYETAAHLVDSLGKRVIAPAEEKLRELAKGKISVLADSIGRS